MNKKWAPVAVAAIVIAVGVVLWQVIKMAGTSENAPSTSAELANSIEKPPSGGKDFGPLDPRITETPPGTPGGPSVPSKGSR